MDSTQDIINEYLNKKETFNIGENEKAPSRTLDNNSIIDDITILDDDMPLLDTGLLSDSIEYGRGIIESPPLVKVPSPLRSNYGSFFDDPESPITSRSNKHRYDRSSLKKKSTDEYETPAMKNVIHNEDQNNFSDFSIDNHTFHNDIKKLLSKSISKKLPDFDESELNEINGIKKYPWIDAEDSFIKQTHKAINSLPKPMTSSKEFENYQKLLHSSIEKLMKQLNSSEERNKRGEKNLNDLNEKLVKVEIENHQIMKNDKIILKENEDLASRIKDLEQQNQKLISESNLTLHKNQKLSAANSNFLNENRLLRQKLIKYKQLYDDLKKKECEDDKLKRDQMVNTKNAQQKGLLKPHLEEVDDLSAEPKAVVDEELILKIINQFMKYQRDGIEVRLDKESPTPEFKIRNQEHVSSAVKREGISSKPKEDQKESNELPNLRMLSIFEQAFEKVREGKNPVRDKEEEIEKKVSDLSENYHSILTPRIIEELSKSVGNFNIGIDKLKTLIDGQRNQGFCCKCLARPVSSLSEVSSIDTSNLNTNDEICNTCQLALEMLTAKERETNERKLHRSFKNRNKYKNTNINAANTYLNDDKNKRDNNNHINSRNNNDGTKKNKNKKKFEGAPLVYRSVDETDLDDDKEQEEETEEYNKKESTQTLMGQFKWNQTL